MSESEASDEPDQIADSVPGAELRTQGIPNLRDIGGYATTDGRSVRLGLVYRSTALGHATASDLELLAYLRLRTVFDLRTPAERKAEPDRLPPGARDLDLDVLADSPGSAAARIPEVFAHPDEASTLLAKTDMGTIFDQIYRGLVSLPSALASYRTLFRDLSEPSTLPALYHCTTGKDRTGWATAALLTLLGVPGESVMKDYLLSNTYLRHALQPMLDSFAERGGDPELLKPILEVRPEYLQAAFDELRLRFGTIEGYFTEGLGLGPDSQKRLSDLFLE
ncbi:tyrosine-protein phosphatase [Humibacter antri]